MHTFTMTHFDLHQIARSGQCFRMNPAGAHTYSVISQGRFLYISQDGCDFSMDCPGEDIPFWRHYFDLDRDYGQIIASVRPKDDYLAKAAAAGQGIRILSQDVWEMIITFILSQQKTIPAIKEAVEALCRSYGTKKELWDGCHYYTFPDAVQLSAASLEDLQALKLGYRAKYIHRICSDCVSGAMDLAGLAALSYDEAMEYLISFYGIGVKVANCVCLFGLHHIDAFPVDTWIDQILNKYYHKKKYEKLPKSQRCQAMIRDNFSMYQGYSGVMQQYIFYYERVVVNGR